MTRDEAEEEAMRLFRIVHGRDDDGSTQAFWRQNPEMINGWIRFARRLEREKQRPLLPRFGGECRVTGE